MMMTVQPIQAASGVVGSLAFGQHSARRVEPRQDASSRPLTQALDALDEALILTDASANVYFVNRAAQAILRSGSLAVRKGVLCATTARETQALHAVVADRHGAAQRAAFLRLSMPGDRGPLLVTVTVSETSAASEPMILVLIRDAGRPAQTSARMIATFFDLTAAEARVACEMIFGDGLKACAQRLGITPNTARTHLNRVFDKTGTKRQAELVRLLLSCCALAGCHDLDRAA